MTRDKNVSMNIKKNTVITLAFVTIFVIFAIVAVYLSRFSNSTAGKLSVGFGGDGLIYEEVCGDDIVKSRVCKITLLNTTSSHAVARIEYQYDKGKEDRNKINVLANKGNFDNTVGVREYYSMTEGTNKIDVVFGLFNPEDHTQSNPYTSNFLTVEVRGVNEKTGYYIRPSIINLTIEYNREWYSE